MHIPHDQVKNIIQEMTRISRGTILHYELHGPSHDFDFHRYPRDYSHLYRDQPETTYEIFESDDFKNAGTDSFHHALLEHKKSAN